MEAAVRVLILLLPLLVGALECFAGFRLAEISVYVWGCLAGAAAGVIYVVVGRGAVTGGILLLLAIGAAGTVLAWQWYAAGVCFQLVTLAGAGVYLAFHSLFLALLAGAAAGLCSVFFPRRTFIITSAAAGGVLILASVYGMMGMRGNHALAVALWAPIALAGVLCQWVTTNEQGGETRPHWSRWQWGETVTRDDTISLRWGWRDEVAMDDTMTFSERKYPGMQRAYRNYCIRCGYDLNGSVRRCPRCGFRLED